MTFKRLAQYFSELEKNSSRLKMTEILVQLLKAAGRKEIDKICYLSQGMLVPQYEGIEFNMAEKMMIRAVALATGQKSEDVLKEYKKVGDLGDVIYNLKFQKSKARAADKNENQSLAETYERLLAIAKDSGAGSVERKVSKMGELLVGADALSAKFLVRIPLGKLRLGFSELTILDAISWMVIGNKSARQDIEYAYNVRADAGQIAWQAKFKGLHTLRDIEAKIGVPIMPALCQRLGTAEEMIEKMGEVVAEPKYDGERLQVHFSRRRKFEDKAEGQLGFGFRPKAFIRAYTRDLENVTWMFPELAEKAPTEIKADEIIFDGELVGYDSKTGKMLPFQQTMQRKRKHSIGEKAKEIPLRFYCFDILYKNGKDLLKTPLSKRRKILEATLSRGNNVLVLSPQIVAKAAQDLRQYHAIQKSRGLEGIVVKKADGVYQAGRRGFNWVKMKEEKGKKGGGLTDTLDCVVMGFYRGRGKRASFGIGGFLVGIRKSAISEQIVTVSKIGTGLTDEQWREMEKRGRQVEVKNQPKEYLVNKLFYPDVWCAPKIVVEIEADNVTKSPSHTAGYSLRFPRLVRFRDDKSASESSTEKELYKLYKLQK